jgi:O-antigen ligase
MAPVKSYVQHSGSASAISAPADGVTTLGLNLYLVFVVSWFLHLGTRVPVLGAIRFDLILVAVLTALALVSKSSKRRPATATDKLLLTLILYAILTIPFVEWPGSVLRTGIAELVKAVVFYYFTVVFVRTESSLRRLVFVFLACQLFRVLEPLYLHLTEGYWGSIASMANWEYLNRLSGAPHDVVNPNGLAFVICTVLPFLYFLSGLSRRTLLAVLALTPLCLYALALTGSRTGFAALIVIYLAIVVRSKKRVLLGAAGVLVLVVGLPLLSGDLQDRFLSLFSAGEKNLATAQGRIEGVMENLRVALRKPLFGHGLGTSREANANFGTHDKPAHNLYAEVLQELGFLGFMVFLFFLKSIITGFAECKRAYNGATQGSFLVRLLDATQVWLILNLVFSLASYGLSSYEWYLLASFSVVMRRLAPASGGSEASRPRGQ